jgi:hypothetical protein
VARGRPDARRSVSKAVQPADLPHAPGDTDSVGQLPRRVGLSKGPPGSAGDKAVFADFLRPQKYGLFHEEPRPGHGSGTLTSSAPDVRTQRRGLAPLPVGGPAGATGARFERTAALTWPRNRFGSIRGSSTRRCSRRGGSAMVMATKVRLVRPGGIEPPTFWSATKRAIPCATGAHYVPGAEGEI